MTHAGTLEIRNTGKEVWPQKQLQEATEGGRVEVSRGHNLYTMCLILCFNIDLSLLPMAVFFPSFLSLHTNSKKLKPRKYKKFR